MIAVCKLGYKKDCKKLGKLVVKGQKLIEKIGKIAVFGTTVNNNN